MAVGWLAVDSFCSSIWHCTVTVHPLASSLLTLSCSDVYTIWHSDNVCSPASYVLFMWTLHANCTCMISKLCSAFCKLRRLTNCKQYQHYSVLILRCFSEVQVLVVIHINIICNVLLWVTQWWKYQCLKVKFVVSAMVFSCCYTDDSWRVCLHAAAVARSSFRMQQRWLDRGSCWLLERMRLQWMWV